MRAEVGVTGTPRAPVSKNHWVTGTGQILKVGYRWVPGANQILEVEYRWVPGTGQNKILGTDWYRVPAKKNFWVLLSTGYWQNFQLCRLQTESSFLSFLRNESKCKDVADYSVGEDLAAMRKSWREEAKNIRAEQAQLGILITQTNFQIQFSSTKIDDLINRIPKQKC